MNSSIFSKNFPNIGSNISDTSQLPSHLTSFSNLSHKLNNSTSSTSDTPSNIPLDPKNLSDHFLSSHQEHQLTPNLHQQAAAAAATTTHNYAPQNMFTPQPLARTITCPQCPRQFDSGPLFWYHFSVEHLNQLSSTTPTLNFNSFANINPLNSHLPSQPALNPLNPLNSSDPSHQNNPVQSSDNSQNYINSTIGGFGLPHHINPAI